MLMIIIVAIQTIAYKMYDGSFRSNKNETTKDLYTFLEGFNDGNTTSTAAVSSINNPKVVTYDEIPKVIIVGAQKGVCT